MIGRKTLVGIALTCVLAFSAMAAGSTSAGQWAYTCLKGGSADFADAHCVTKSLTGPYGHVVVAEAKLAVTTTNEKTASETTAAAASVLTGSVSSIPTQVTCTTVSGTGELTNSSSPANHVSGTGILTYTGCSVTVPAAEGCQVKGGMYTTKTLSATTEGQAANKLLVKPSTGTEIAAVSIESCTNATLNNTFPVTGSFVASTTGATTITTHADTTAQGTLKLASAKAGLEGALTTSGSKGTIALT